MLKIRITINTSNTSNTIKTKRSEERSINKSIRVSIELSTHNNK